MHFTKMHGLGNDYLFVYGEVPPDAAQLSVRLSDRHFGAGSDGMIHIGPSSVADFKMRIFNADGSEAEMCGNGIRCVGKYVYDKGLTRRTSLTVETLCGIKHLGLEVDGDTVRAASVNMGQAIVRPQMTLEVNHATITCTPASMGNPHAVIFVEDAKTAPVAELGPLIERHDAFPDGVNVEFVQVLSEHKLRMRVWERGSGVTMACGTGSCASVAAAVRNRLCPSNEAVEVQLDGGSLQVVVDGAYEVTMTGPAQTVYEGEVTL